MCCETSCPLNAQLLMSSARMRTMRMRHRLWYEIMGNEFEKLWAAHGDQVVQYCRRYLGNSGDAEEVAQRVAIRAWRGLKSFRGDSLFLTWVIRITRNEVNRFLQSRQRQRERAVQLVDDGLAVEHRSIDDTANAESGHDTPSATNASVDSTGPNREAVVIQSAVAQQALTEREALVIQARLVRHNATWNDVGASLSLSASNAAAIHCRAIPKLRVYIFCFQKDLCGGHATLATAFEKAGNSTSEPLTELESDVFRRRVLESDVHFRAKGWETALRIACAKVSHHLPWVDSQRTPSLVSGSVGERS